ncbi:TPA: hypothetical protein QDB06_000788 [Burkholderia vietnamiensis]|nr:hypothetical protein [Burkholderia vietnamiensis]
MNIPEYEEIQKVWETVQKEYDSSASGDDIYKIVETMGGHYCGRFHDSDRLQEYLDPEVFCRIAAKIYSETENIKQVSEGVMLEAVKKEMVNHFSKEGLVHCGFLYFEAEQYKWDDYAILERATNGGMRGIPEYVVLNNGYYLAASDVAWTNERDPLILEALFEAKHELILDDILYIEYIAVSPYEIDESIKHLEKFIPIGIKSDPDFIRELSHVVIDAANKYMGELVGSEISFDNADDLGDFIDNYVERKKFAETLDQKLPDKKAKDPMELRDSLTATGNGTAKTKSNKLKI